MSWRYALLLVAGLMAFVVLRAAAETRRMNGSAADDVAAPRAERVDAPRDADLATAPEPERSTTEPAASPDASRDAPSTAAAPRTGGVRAVSVSVGALGRSGALRSRLAQPGGSVVVPLHWAGDADARTWYRWVPRLGTVDPAGSTEGVRPLPPPGPDGLPSAIGASEPVLTAPSRPGIYALEVGGQGWSRRLEGFHLVVNVPYRRASGGSINGYRIGRFPTEGENRRDRYAPPGGFIEVTRENQNLHLSRSFRIREFLTKDQHDRWPKYVVVDTLLLDKLELVLDELNASGVRAERMHVMSGFRTPQYNRAIGQSRLSRHQFGDAADVWIDNEGNGYMSDLNGDGRRDIEDARVILRAVERVETRYPELVGGAGLYPARRGVRGPFIHIDVRGRRARW